MVMVSGNSRLTVLVWHSGHESDRTFNALALSILALFMTLTILISSLPAPKIDRTIPTVIPERIVKFMDEMAKPPPLPEKKAEPLPPPKAEDSIQRQAPVTSKPQTKTEEHARKVAQGSGLLVLAKELSVLADTSSINTMVAKKINTAPTNTAAATVDTRILANDTGRSSSGVSQGAHVANVGTTKLEDNQKQVTQGLLAASTAKAAGPAGGAEKSGHGTNVRGDEDVAMVMDQHKSVLYSIYNRARRSNPGLKGKIVLVLTILPSGQVSNVVIKSSELNSPELEASMVARIRQFDFGKRQGGPLTVTIPVEFLPS
jgi:periplasmic protein TonB